MYELSSCKHPDYANIRNACSLYRSSIAIYQKNIILTMCHQGHLDAFVLEFIFYASNDGLNIWARPPFFAAENLETSIDWSWGHNRHRIKRPAKTDSLEFCSVLWMWRLQTRLKSPTRSRRSSFRASATSQPAHALTCWRRSQSVANYRRWQIGGRSFKSILSLPLEPQCHNNKKHKIPIERYAKTDPRE